MTAGLDWRIEGEPAAPAPSGPPAQQRRRLWLLFIGLALPLLALGGLMFVANRRQGELAGQVRRVAEMEEAALRSGDAGKFLALQDRADEAWLGLQDSRLKQSSFYAVPEFGLIGAGGPATYGDVVLEDGFARLDVTRTFSVTNRAGFTTTVPLAMPQLYRPWGNGWVRAWPPSQWWGLPQTYVGQRLRVTYPARDAGAVLPLATRLDDWAERACVDWDCPDDARYTIQFAPTIGALLWLNQAHFTEGSMTLPTPALVAVPASAGGDDPVALGFGRLLVHALAVDLSGSQGGPLLEALAVAEQARLGLAPQPQPDRTGTIAQAWRDGQLDFLSGPMATRAEAVVAFLHDTYPERGERALLGTLSSPDPLGLRLANALGLSPNTLSQSWLAYGQAHWSNTAGRPPPQGELALVCNNDHSVRLRELASGTTRDLTVLPIEVLSLAWSPGGAWLEASARSGPSDYIWLGSVGTDQGSQFMGRSQLLACGTNSCVVVLGPQRGQFMGRLQFVAWAPDGDHYAVYQPGPGQTSIYSLSGRLAQALPETPSVVTWSPNGDKLAFVARDDTIWMAAGDGTQARPLVRGLAPAWSPDGRSLAYLLPDSLFFPAPELAVTDVDTGATRTLLTISDLSADLIAPGFASHRFWATALYDALWSPDGTRLAVRVGLEDATGSHMGLVTVSADGSTRRIWLVTEHIEQMSWSPDARGLAALTTSHFAGPERVWVAAADSSAQATVAGVEMDWSPDGNWLAVQQQAGAAILSTDLSAAWRLPPGCRIGGWRPLRDSASRGNGK